MDAVPDEFSWFLPTQFFPASRGLSRRGKNEKRERPLPALDALFDAAADHFAISGRNLPVFKTGSAVYCVRRVPHVTIVFVFCFLSFRLLLFKCNFPL